MYPVIEQRRQVDHGIPGLHAVGEGDSGSWQDICTLENEILLPGGNTSKHYEQCFSVGR